VLGLVLGNQTVLFGLFLSFLRIRVVRPDPEVPVREDDRPLSGTVGRL
jgi:hypothetical protein